MSGRILRFESPEHRRVDALLPWYVNGTLHDDESARVEAHMPECARCQRELEWLRELQADCAKSDPLPQADVEAALQRMRRRLDVGFGRRSLASVRRAREGWRRAPAWTRWAMVAQLVLCASLAGVLIHGRVDGRGAAAYHTLGAAAAPQTGYARLVLTFDPAISERELRQALRASGARIVDGPTATGVYLLAVRPDRAVHALATLRASRGVRLVENLSPVPRGR